MTDLSSLMAADTPATGDRTRAIAERLREHRDVVRQIADAEARTAELSQRRTTLEREVLPEMFAEAGVDRLDIPAEGNMPALRAELTDYYRALIAASWDEERRERGFAVLDELGLGDVVSHVVTIKFARGEADVASALAAELVDMGYHPAIRREVPWQTLTAAIREHYRGGGRLTQEQRDAIGAFVGRVVVPKERASG